jgi:hypothetical protein
MIPFRHASDFFFLPSRAPPVCLFICALYTSLLLLHAGPGFIEKAERAYWLTCCLGLINFLGVQRSASFISLKRVDNSFLSLRFSPTIDNNKTNPVPAAGFPLPHLCAQKGIAIANGVCKSK